MHNANGDKWAKFDKNIKKSQVILHISQKSITLVKKEKNY